MKGGTQPSGTCSDLELCAIVQLHEWQAKGILSRFGFDIPSGVLCRSEQDVRSALATLQLPVVVKAQIREWHRGDRGLVVKAGDVQAAVAAWEQIQSTLHSNGGEASTVPCLVEEALEIQAEFYLGELIDPELQRRTILASRHGGQRVEGEAGDMVRIPIPFEAAVATYQARRVARVWGVHGPVEAAVTIALRGLHDAFCHEECRLIEINPLAVTPDGRLVALDAKMIVDDNAIPRRADLSAEARILADSSAEARLRLEHGIEYVGLDGDIGLISGGAGMTMAAIDLIAQSGGRPRCFLDCSQNATEAGYGTALQYLLDDARTRTVLVNIVGGGTAVDEVAQIFVDLIAGRGLSKPVLIRLEGTGADRAREILTASGLSSYRSLEAMVTDALLAEPVQP